MPRKGTTSRGGAGLRAEIKVITKGVSFTPELIAAIDALPQVTSKEWSRSYLINQVLLNWLRMKADYNQGDLELIVEGRIVE
jgi:hypothetical protein